MGSFEVGLLSAQVQPTSGTTWFTAGGYLVGLFAVVASLLWAIALAIAQRTARPSRHRNNNNDASIKT